MSIEIRRLDPSPAPAAEIDARYSTFLAITRLFAEEAPPDTIPVRLLTVILQSLDWDAGALWQVNPDSQVIRCVEFAHRDDISLLEFEAMTRSTQFPRGGMVSRGIGLPGRVWETGEPAWIADVTRDPTFTRAPVAVRAGLHGACGFPIVVEGEVVGVLEVFTRQVREPDAILLSMMGAVGTLTGQFLERRQAETDAAIHRALLEAHNEATIDGIVISSETGEILSYNRRFLELWGFDEDTMEPSGVAALEAAIDKVADPEAFRADLRRIGVDPDWTGRDEIRLRDGRIFERFTAPLRGADGVRFGRAWHYRDVSERKRTERALTDTSARFAHVARTLQQSLLPPHLPQIPGIEVAARFHPAGEGLEVGGDFYDLFDTGRDDWAIVIGDVCGKGADAASLTALARYTIRAAAIQARKPSRVLAMLNEALLRQTEAERFATVAYLRIRRTATGHRLSVASGGHPLPLLVRGGTVETIGRPGIVLGITPDPRLSDRFMMLKPGDVVVLYTDGVTEARGEDDSMLGEERLRRTLAACAGADADTIAGRIKDEALGFQGGTARDDIAVVTLRVLA